VSLPADDSNAGSLRPGTSARRGEGARERSVEDASSAPRGIATQLIHHDYQPPGGFAAPQVGVHKASTVIFPNVAALRARDWKHKTGYTYGLHGTPTTFTLEERIATLEGGTACVLAPSGLAAIALVDFALLAAGDEVLIPDNAYGPGKDLARSDLARWGIAHRTYDPMDGDALAAMIGPATKLVWIEAPGSVTMEFPDLRRLVRIVKSKGAIAALDNTWGAGIAFNAFDLGEGVGVDISMHALTKYPSGGGDVLMGSLVTCDEALHLKLKLGHMRMGLGTGANDAELLLRSLPSLALRYTAHDRAARQVAAWLQSRPEVARVLHPAFDGSPGHAHWKETCTAAAGLFSVVFDERYSAAQIDAFVDALRLFRIGYSWGGPVSLAVPYQCAAMRTLPSSYAGPLVRLSIGLEEVDDLIADLTQALAVFAA
jgi:cystathionine beta-lyase